MDAKNILAGAIAGTAAMTAFSYFISDKKSKDFREPALLAKMISRAFPETEKGFSKTAGWMMHASMGILFAYLSKKMIQKLQSPYDLSNRVFIGAANGVAGVIGWKLVFSLHPNPPKIQFNRFYQHLVLTHIVFTLTALAAMERNEKESAANE
jgi:hypothetical protein